MQALKAAAKRLNVVYGMETNSQLAVRALSASTPGPNQALRAQMLQDAAADTQYADLLILAELNEAPDYAAMDGLLYYSPPDCALWLYVLPGPSHDTILHEAHNATQHLGRDKTLDTLRRYYFWPTMATVVETYVRSCHTCQRNKSRTQRPLGQLQPPPIPDHVWQEVVHDRVTGLPPTSCNQPTCAHASFYIALAGIHPHRCQGSLADEYKTTWLCSSPIVASVQQFALQ